MVKSSKQRYYAALEHEENAGKLFDRQRKEEMLLSEIRGEEQLYADIGARAYRAFANILDSLGDMAARTGTGRADGIDQNVRRELDAIAEQLRTMRHKLEQQDLVLHEVTAGIRRIDKFTLEAFQRINAGEGVYGDEGFGKPTTSRLSKEETTERALRAARELQEQGERLTLKAVARRAGLRYAQVVYAFGRKDELLSRLEQQSWEQDDGEWTA